MTINSKIYAYCRVSTVDQTVEQQQDRIRKHYPEGTEFVWLIEKLSGWKQIARPEFDWLCGAIKRFQVKEVCSVAVSRIARNLWGAVDFCKLCQEHGVKLTCLDLPFDLSGPLGQGMLALMSSFAQAESDTKSHFIKAKFDHQKSRGEFIAHGCPPGCVTEKVKKLAPAIFAMSDQGQRQVHIARTLKLTERVVANVLKRRGETLLTRKEYAKLCPDWYRLPADQRLHASELAKRLPQKQGRKQEK